MCLLRITGLALVALAVACLSVLLFGKGMHSAPHTFDMVSIAKLLLWTGVGGGFLIGMPLLFIPDKASHNETKD